MRATFTPSGRRIGSRSTPRRCCWSAPPSSRRSRTRSPALAGGAGGVVVLEAGAGLGKTALLDHAARARRATPAASVRRAAPSPLERHFRYGVCARCSRAPLRDASVRERARLLEGAAADAGALLLGGARARPRRHDDGRPQRLLAVLGPRRRRARSCSWSTTPSGPTAPSLEVSAYLARRIDELPAADRSSAARADDPARAVRPAQPARRRPRGDRAAARAADRPGRRDADPPPRAARAAARLPRLPPRRRRQPVAAGRARPPDRRVTARPRRRRLRPATPRPSPPSRATSCAGAWPRSRRATAPSPRRSPSSATARRCTSSPRLAGIALGELGPARDALRAAGLLALDGTRLAHGLIATAIVDDLPRDRARAPAPRGRPRCSTAAARAPTPSPATCSTAARTATRRSARCSCARPPTPPTAARPHDGGRLPRARAGRARAPATTAARCSPSSARPRSTPACPTRAARLHDALREPHDRDSRRRRAHPAGRAGRRRPAPGADELPERELRRRARPRRASRSRSPRSTR